MTGTSMRLNRFYMHKNAMDVCIQVRKSYQVTPDRFIVQAAWTNLGYAGRPYSLGITHRIDIANPQDWVDITFDITKVRTKSGLP